MKRADFFLTSSKDNLKGYSFIDLQDINRFKKYAYI